MAKSPTPPAPTAPAIVVSPIRLMRVIIETLAMPGILSLKYTEKIISMGENPMASLASISPGSTSAIAVSICLEKKGTVPNIRGTYAPSTPRLVPTIALLIGMRRNKSIRKGIDLSMSIALSITLYTGTHSSIPPFFVTISSEPKKSPKKKDIIPDTATIWTVWPVHFISSGASFSRFGKI